MEVFKDNYNNIRMNLLKPQVIYKDVNQDYLLVKVNWIVWMEQFLIYKVVVKVRLLWFKRVFLVVRLKEIN